MEYHYAATVAAAGDPRLQPGAHRPGRHGCNLVALDCEIAAAKTIAAGNGMLAVNVMRAVSGCADYVRQACASGADAIVNRRPTRRMF